MPATPWSQPGDDPAGTEREVQRGAAVVGGVELLAGAEGHADVVHPDTSGPAVASDPVPSVMSSDVQVSVGGSPSGNSISGFLSSLTGTTRQCHGRRTRGRSGGVPDGATGRDPAMLSA